MLKQVTANSIINRLSLFFFTIHTSDLMLMKRHFLFLTALLALALSSCSPFQLVNSETYNDANLSDYNTFRIVTPDMGKLPPGMEMVSYYNIAAAIREEMLERGYTEDPSSQLLINFAVTVHKKIATEPLVPPGAGPIPPVPYYNGYYPWYVYPRYNYWNNYYNNAQVITGIYKEGVLTMDMVNIKTMVPLYSSSVATIINQGDGSYRNLSSIAEAVQTLFSKFPVPMLPQYRNMK